MKANERTKDTPLPSPSSSLWISASMQVQIRGCRNEWRVSTEPGLGHDCTIYLELIGSRLNGFSLLVKPEGFDAVDYYFESLFDAKQAARELFAVAPHQWIERNGEDLL